MEIINFLQNFFPELNNINFLNYTIRITLFLYVLTFLIFILLIIKYVLSSFFNTKEIKSLYDETNFSLFIKRIKYSSIFLFLFIFSLPIYLVITVNILKHDQYFLNTIKEKPDIIKYTENILNFDKKYLFFYQIKKLEKTNFSNKKLLNENNSNIYIKIKQILLEKNTNTNNISGNIKNIIIKNEDVDTPDLFHFFLTYNNKIPFNIKINKMKLEKISKNLILIKNFDGLIDSKYIKNVRIKGNLILNKKLNNLTIINIKLEKKELTNNEINVLYQLYNSYYNNFKENTNYNILMINTKKELTQMEFLSFLSQILNTQNFKNIKINIKNININY